MANTITNLTTANTFQQWLNATQLVVSRLNLLNEGGNNEVFVANTNIEIANNLTVTGNLTVSGNIILDEIGFDDLLVNGSASIANTLTVGGNTTLSNVIITSNVSTVNVTTKLEVGTNANVYGALYVAGDAVFGGNVTLDTVGFDDLTVTGNASITLNTTVGGTLNVTDNSTFTNANVTNILVANVAHITSANISTANVISLVGDANTAIYNRIVAAEATALAFSIALG